MARTFQAHQDFHLVKDSIREASGWTDLLVATNVAAHYERSDYPPEEINALFASAVGLLSILAHSLGILCLESAPYASNERRDLILDLAVDTIECERTSLEYCFASDDFDTMGYWQRG